MIFPNEIPLTLVLVKDDRSTRISSYFEELPNIHASGDNEEEAAQELVNAVMAVFRYKQIEAETQLAEKRFTLTREKYKLSLA